ncbi:MAG: START domain-containing protein [Pseudomonadales bacterium]|nr:START domain-containing protein [Pseudomonadales bacterium]
MDTKLTESWRLEKHKKGIKVFTQPYPTSHYKAYRAEMIINGSMDPFLTVFEDVAGYKDWMHTTIKSELVDEPEAGVKHIYMVNRNLPITDRDYFARLETSHNTDGSINVSWKLLDKPQKKGKVRVTKLEVLIGLLPLGNDSFKVVLTGHFEPGGLVPSALANAFITDVPFNTFLKVRKLTSRI